MFTACLLLASSSAAAMKPLLFMDLHDAAPSPAPWGKLLPRANAIKAMPSLVLPRFNWTGGDTTFAAFEDLGAPGTYEVFIAVGRPGEPYRRPILDAQYHLSKPPPAPPGSGVKIQRITTTDFNEWTEPITVGWLPSGSGEDDQSSVEYAQGKRNYGFQPLDGSIWTVKSMDRNPATGEYLMFASYGSSAHTFTAVKPRTAYAFKPTTGSLKTSNFKDHDDCNVIFDAGTKQWVDLQIMYELYSAIGLDATKIKKYCDNVSNDTRRVVTVRTSTDGTKWSQDWGCADPTQKDEHCKTFNTSALISACDCALDPPDLEFYRIRAFHLGASGRLAAHALNYVPSPHSVVYSPGYGRQPLWYCKHGCCHGPHSFEEWWLGPSNGDPRAMTSWRRPFRDTHAAPHDTWLMAQPITTPTQHLFIDSGVRLHVTAALQSILCIVVVVVVVVDATHLHH